MNAIAILGGFLSILGFILLVVIIHRLVSSFTGWKYEYNASTYQNIVKIPKPDTYSINICYTKFNMMTSNFKLVKMLSAVDFEIIDMSTNTTIFFQKCMGIKSSSFSRITWPIGRFNVMHEGDYCLANLSAYPFSTSDTILIRKYLPVFQAVLLILGIIVSSFLFIGGIVMCFFFLVK